MGSKGWSKYGLLIIIAVVFQFQAPKVEACQEEERLGSLQIKAFINSLVHPNLVPWSDKNGDDRENCCRWERVGCDSSTGHITHLDLSSMSMMRHHNPWTWMFNATLFRPFNQLISLDLYNNSINGFVEAHGICTLRKLRKLSLSDNDIDGSTLPSCLYNLTSLRHLDISNNALWGKFPKTLQNLPTSLEYLDLSYNHFNGSLPPCLSKLTSLRHLDLSSSNLSGKFPTNMFQNLTSLESLDLSANQLNGSQPLCLSNLTSLRHLDLSGNDLSGNFPTKMLQNLTSLESFDLSFNFLKGKLSLSFFANFSRLRILDLTNNNLEVCTEDLLWQPTFQLQHLGLEDCSLNKPNGTIPKFLLSQYHLTSIDLSSNRLVGGFPTWLFNNNPRLQSLSLKDNSLEGCLHLPGHIVLSLLEMLDVSSNNLQCQLPENLGVAFPNLTDLYMYWNQFEGTIPTSIARMSKVETVNLSGNNFSGALPKQLLTDCRALQYLILSDNHLEGQMFPNYMNLTNLVYLSLSNNNFGGTLENALLKSTQLEQMFISKKQGHRSIS